MSTIEIDSGKNNLFEFMLNIKGSAQGVSSARLSLISEGKIVSFPCKVITDRESTKLEAQVNDLVGSYDIYKLEVFIEERYFVPIEGTVIVKESIRVESVKTPEKPKIEVNSSGPTVIQTDVVKVQPPKVEAGYPLPSAPESRPPEPRRGRTLYREGVQQKPMNYVSQGDALIEAALTGDKTNDGE